MAGVVGPAVDLAAGTVASAVTTYLHRVAAGGQPDVIVSVDPVDVSGQPTSLPIVPLGGMRPLRLVAA